MGWQRREGSARRPLLVLLGSILGLLLWLAPAAGAVGVDQTCELGLTRFDPDTVNVAFPDDSAEYFVGSYQALPGTRIRITGRFPHARYISFNVYDPAQRPLDALADVELQPDPGSSNPFHRGANRNVAARSYTAYIDFGPAPAQRAPNTLYTGTGQGGTPNYAGTFIYRIYIPDRGRDQFGGVGLPTVSLELAGGGNPPSSLCTGFQRPGITGVNQGVAGLDGLGSRGPALFDRNPPVWRKFTNLFQASADNLTDSAVTDPLFALQRSLSLSTLGGQGGFLSNIHNAYLSAGINKAYGDVVVTRLRAPTFPNTRPGTSPMPGGQVRYWSICENDPATERFIGCINDDRAVVGRDGFATFVVSTPSQRPSNATARCGVNWLPFGPNARGVLIYRHMLPDPSFAQSIQRAAFGREASTMGSYFPTSRYLATKGDFQATGCHPPRGGSGAGGGRALRLSVRPRRASAGCRRFSMRVTSGGRPVGGALVTLTRRRATTNRRGAVTMRLCLRRGLYRVRASHRGYRSASTRVTIWGSIPLYAG